MQVAGSGVVVTGSASGIGKALAKRLVANGARVVLNDLDSALTETAAAEVGGFPVPGDCAAQTDVIIEAARRELGRIDVWFGNAGIVRGLGLGATDDDWVANWEVNTMAHVRAARLLVPTWLEEGRGRFVITASAAGLLTALDLATYSVTKHGAVAFAEWLSATYRHRGIVVQAICPQGVRTKMLAATGPVKQLILEDAVTPDAVAQLTVAALATDQFLILPHPDSADLYARRAADTDRWLLGMNKLQRRLDAATPESELSSTRSIHHYDY